MLKIYIKETIHLLSLLIKGKEKVEKATEFAESMKKAQKEAGVVLRKVQKKMK